MASKKLSKLSPEEIDEVAPTLVNGIKDPAAAAALASAGIDDLPKKKRAGTVRTDQRKTTSAKTSKSKALKTAPLKGSAGKPKKISSSGKVVHPKAPISFRRNFLPPILGILLGLGFLGLLNGQWLVAQYQYRFTTPPTAASYTAVPTTTDPNAPARLYIPKINVSAPVVTDVKSYDAVPVQLALRKGVVQYGSASADPGQKGNIVFIGHSSGQLWAPGEYKFVFTLLDKLVHDDRILVDFKGKRYIYRVSGSKIVPPTDLSVLQPSDEPQLTLITCTPVGTSKNRLIITARQVSPKPETATAIDTNLARPASNITITN